MPLYAKPNNSQPRLSHRIADPPRPIQIVFGQGLLRGVRGFPLLLRRTHVLVDAGHGWQGRADASADGTIVETMS